MKILDARGRLFGKVSLLDLGALAVILLVIVGIFIVPGTSGTSTIAQIADTKPIEVDVIVRGLSILDPQILLKELARTKKANIIIRNQPYGQVDVKTVQQLPKTLVMPQPDGSAKVVPDPRTDTYSTDLRLTLGGKAQITKDGAVLGNNKIKIGTPIELEGFNYDFNASVIDIRIQQ
jgi:hypothetical protein